MTLYWQDLRPLNGSQQSAFEELCCQLAAHESIPDASQFVRKGTPDAGVEYFWKLANGDEWCWQAKFFQTMETTQWRQLDESVNTALDKHPRLVKYVVCIPLDRSDPGDGKKWFMDKWNAWVDKWTNLVAEKGRSVEFE